MRLCERISILNKIGPVIICFIFGLFLSFSGILPDNAIETQDLIMSLSVVVALPMLLFSSNIKTWKSLAGKTSLSFILGMISLIIIVAVGYTLWNDKIDNADKIGGMMIGLYTGGTPNLAALKTALNVTPETYLLITTYDLAYGVVFLLSIMTFGKFLLKFVLPIYKSQKLKSTSFNLSTETFKDTNPFKKGKSKQLIFVFILSLMIGGISLGLSILFTGEVNMLILILSLTSLSLLSGLNRKVKKAESAFNFGMYFILIFSLTLASMVQPSILQNISYELFYFIGFTIFGTLFLHIILSAIFRIDRDTTIVTSTALVCSPPFVPMIANSVKNKEIILPGITIGIIGYAVGNYLGVLMAWFLENYL